MDVKAVKNLAFRIIESREEVEISILAKDLYEQCFPTPEAKPEQNPDDGWVSASTRLPKVGETVEIETGLEGAPNKGTLKKYGDLLGWDLGNMVFSKGSVKRWRPLDWEKQANQSFGQAPKDPEAETTQKDESFIGMLQKALANICGENVQNNTGRLRQLESEGWISMSTSLPPMGEEVEVKVSLNDEKTYKARIIQHQGYAWDFGKYKIPLSSVWVWRSIKNKEDEVDWLYEDRDAGEIKYRSTPHPTLRSLPFTKEVMALGPLLATALIVTENEELFKSFGGVIPTKKRNVDVFPGKADK